MSVIQVTKNLLFSVVFKPNMIPLGRVIESVHCGWTHTLLHSSDSWMVTMGRNDYGQLGRYKENKTGFKIAVKLDLKPIVMVVKKKDRWWKDEQTDRQINWTS